MEASDWFLPGAVVGLILVMAILGIVYRVIAKLGVRNFFRHKGHAVISVAGLLVGTSIICASMVVGDSIEYFIVEETYETLGEIDVTVAISDGGFPESIYHDLAADPEVSASTDGLAPLLGMNAVARNLATGQFEPSVNVIGFEPQADHAFGAFTTLDGTETYGDELPMNGSFINGAVADNLGAGIGDRLTLTYNIGSALNSNYMEWTLTVTGIVQDTGKALYSAGLGSMSLETMNIFVTLDTAQSMFLMPGMVNHIKVSNIGGVEDGVEGSEELALLIESRVQDLEPVTVAGEPLFPVEAQGQTMALLSHGNLVPGSYSLTLYDSSDPLNLTPLNGAVMGEPFNYTTTQYLMDPSQGTVVLLLPLTANQTVFADYDYELPALEVDTHKKDMLDAAKAINEIVSTFLTIFGSFAIIAGVILIINIFTMLAEERKSELGMARAVGMKRRHLMFSFLYEGLAYGSVASAVGTLAGVGVGAVLIFLVNELVDFIGVNIPFHFQWFSLLEAFSLGFVITFATILLTSWKISKLNIIRAIRGIEEPKRERGFWLFMLLGAGLLTMSALAVYRSWDSPFVQLLGPSGIVVGVMILVWKWAGTRVSVTVGSLWTLVYCLWAIRNLFDDVDPDDVDMLFIMSGVIIVLSFVLLVMYNSVVVIRAVTGTFGRIRRFRPTVVTAVSYPLTKKFRSGMSVAMFALVIYMIAMLSVFSNMFVVDVNEETVKQGGGFELQGSSMIPVADIGNVTYYDQQHDVYVPIVSDALQDNITGYLQVSMTYTSEVNVTDAVEVPDTSFMGIDIPGLRGSVLYGVDSEFAGHIEYQFNKYSDDYASEAEVWAALIAPGSDKVVMNTMMTFITYADVGNHVRLTKPYTGNVTSEFEIIGIVDESMLTGLFMSKENLFNNFYVDKNSVFLFDVADGCDEQATADALERDFQFLGLNSILVREVAETTMETTNSLFVLFEIYLYMGMVVGVAGLGVITVRSVVERTPEIGILRALGFRRGNIRNAFLIEILFVATIGVVIGIVSGVVVAHEIFNIIVAEYGQGIDFVIPWGRIALVVAIAYLATIICTIIPARNASRVAPASALRYVG